MTIEWLAGNRIRGTTAERPALGLPSGSVGGWVEVGRTTLGSAGDDITVSSLDDKRYYMMLFSSSNSTGRTGHNWRFNGDTGSNYAYRRGRDGSEAASGSKTSITWGESVSAGWDNDFSINYVSNLSNKEKLALGHCGHSQSTGAGTAPNRTENVGKWTNTSDAINSITAYNPEAGSFGSGDEVVVLGYDPDDTHTDNFWEELASVNASGSATSFDTGTFTPKKYLWVQVYSNTNSSAGTNITLRVGNGSIDTGSNYARRYNINGSEGTMTSNTQMFQVEATESGFMNCFIVNNSSTEKLIIGHGIEGNTSGGNTGVDRDAGAGKWSNASDQINIIGVYSAAGGSPPNYTTDSFIKVWGHD